MFNISDTILHERCTAPLERLTPVAAHELAYRVFGPNLSRCLLRPEVLQLVAEHDRVRGHAEARGYWLSRPPLPTGPGACWGVFAQDDYPLLRPAFVLPLEWRQDQTHSRRLPPSLLALAGEISDQASLPKFGLYGSSQAGMDECDFSDLHRVTSRSAWASLFSGLVVASEGGLPDPTVWASGDWSPEKGVQCVGHWEAKLDLACKWGAQQFFLPDSQCGEAKRWVGEHGADMVIGALSEGDPKSAQHTPRGALRAYLADFGAPPDRNAPREARKRYYLRQTSDEKRREYYRRCLLDDIAHDCRRQLEAEGCLPHPTHMVTILSTSPELVELGVRIFRPSQVLVLHTDDMKKNLAGALAAIRQCLPDCHPKPQEFEVGDPMVPQLRAAIDEFTRGVAPENVVFDLLPGTKEMTLALSMELCWPGVWLYYLRHKREGSVAVPFEQKPVLRAANLRNTTASSSQEVTWPCVPASEGLARGPATGFR